MFVRSSVLVRAIRAELQTIPTRHIPTTTQTKQTTVTRGHEVINIKPKDFEGTHIQ